MNSAAGQCSLFLYPEQHNFKLNEISSLVSVLQDIGFVSETIQSDTSEHLYTGDRFLDYIAYMGCSPAIQFEASGDNDNFCHIKIHQSDSAHLIVSQKQSRAPHCPHCGKPVKNWRDHQTERQIFCTQCHTAANIEEFNWRKMAGYASLFIEITDVFPKEAIPQQLLLDKLKQKFDVDWQYFYACQ